MGNNTRVTKSISKREIAFINKQREKANAKRLSRKNNENKKRGNSLDSQAIEG